MADDTTNQDVRYFIHPAVGIARIGDSEEQFFLAPEMPGTFRGPDGIYTFAKSAADDAAPESTLVTEPAPDENPLSTTASTPMTLDYAADGKGYRDGDDKIRRQGVRFRIFKYTYENQEKTNNSPDGEDDERHKTRNPPISIEEVTADQAEITWKVHVANMKGIVPKTKFKGTWEIESFYEVSGKVAHELYNSELRYKNNSKTMCIGGVERHMDIESGFETMTSVKSINIPDIIIEKIQGETPLQLGTLLTDNKGRLIFLGGTGQIASMEGHEVLQPWSGNDVFREGWFDDTCDGLITAEIKLKSEAEPVPKEHIYPGWVVSALPKYGGPVLPLISMYDRAEHMVYGKQPLPAELDNAIYNSYIYPILHNLDLMQWVSYNIRHAKSHGGPETTYDSEKSTLLTQLENNYAYTKSLICGKIRPIDTTKGVNPDKLMPYIRGNDGGPQYVSFTPRQVDYFYAWLSSTDTFTVYPSAEERYAPVTSSLDKANWNSDGIDPRNIDRAHLETIIGGGFSPGVEVNKAMTYRPGVSGEGEFYKKYQFFNINGAFGIWRDPQSSPLTYFYRIAEKIEPGNLTFGLPVPWQVDVKHCGEEWWPSTVPTHVKRTTWQPEAPWEFYYVWLLNDQFSAFLSSSNAYYWADQGFIQSQRYILERPDNETESTDSLAEGDEGQYIVFDEGS